MIARACSSFATNRHRHPPFFIYRFVPCALPRALRAARTHRTGHGGADDSQTNTAGDEGSTVTNHHRNDGPLGIDEDNGTVALSFVVRMRVVYGIGLNKMMMCFVCAIAPSTASDVRISGIDLFDAFFSCLFIAELIARWKCYRIKHQDCVMSTFDGVGRCNEQRQCRRMESAGICVFGMKRFLSIGLTASLLACSFSTVTARQNVSADSFALPAGLTPDIIHLLESSGPTHKTSTVSSTQDDPASFARGLMRAVDAAGLWTPRYVGVCDDPGGRRDCLSP